MRILMFGRGVISTIYGHAFDEAGNDVEFYVRPGRRADYGDEVRMELIDARRSLFGRRVHSIASTRLRESVEPEDGFDLVVVSVGHHRLHEAAAYLAPRIGAATVLVFGNVWQEPAAAVAPLPADQVVFGFPGAGGGFVGTNALSGALLRSVVLGVTSAPASEREELVRSVFTRAGFRVSTEADMRGWLWLHFIMDAGMFAQARQTGGLAKMIGDRHAISEAFRTARELLPLVQARGIDLRRHVAAAIPARVPRLIGSASALATVLAPIARASLAAHTDPDSPESRAVIGDVLATARRLSITTPRLAAIADEFPETESRPDQTT